MGVLPEKRCEKQVRVGDRVNGAKYRKLSMVKMDARWMKEEIK